MMKTVEDLRAWIASPAGAGSRQRLAQVVAMTAAQGGIHSITRQTVWDGWVAINVVWNSGEAGVWITADEAAEALEALIREETA